MLAEEQLPAEEVREPCRCAVRVLQCFLQEEWRPGSDYIMS